MPNYAMVVDLAIRQSDEQKKKMLDFGILDGKPIIFELQDLTTSAASELSGLSINKTARTQEEAFRRMNINMPVATLRMNLNKCLQRIALQSNGCQDLQPEFEMIHFTSDDEVDRESYNKISISKLLSRSASQNFVLKNSSSTTGYGNIFLTRKQLEDYCTESYKDFCDLEFTLRMADGTERNVKIGDVEHSVFSLEECVNPSFYESVGEGRAYRIALFYNAEFPEDESHITLLHTHHLNDTPDSHSHDGTSLIDYIDRAYYKYAAKPNRIADVRHDDIRDVVLGEGLIRDMFRAARACEVYNRGLISRAVRPSFTTAISFPALKKKNSNDEKVVNALRLRSYKNYVENIKSLLAAIGFEFGVYKEVEINDEERLKIMLKRSDGVLEDDLYSAFISEDAIIEKGKNLLHLLMPYILKNELLWMFDSTNPTCYHAKKLLVNLAGFDPKVCGKELFNDLLLRPAVELADKLRHPFLGGKFDFPGVIISRRIGDIDHEIHYNDGVICSARRPIELINKAEYLLEEHMYHQYGNIGFRANLRAGLRTATRAGAGWGSSDSESELTLTCKPNRKIITNLELSSEEKSKELFDIVATREDFFRSIDIRKKSGTGLVVNAKSHLHDRLLAILINDDVIKIDELMISAMRLEYSYLEIFTRLAQDLLVTGHDDNREFFGSAPKDIPLIINSTRYEKDLESSPECMRDIVDVRDFVLSANVGIQDAVAIFITRILYSFEPAFFLLKDGIYQKHGSTLEMIRDSSDDQIKSHIMTVVGEFLDFCTKSRIEIERRNILSLVNDVIDKSFVADYKERFFLSRISSRSQDLSAIHDRSGLEEAIEIDPAILPPGTSITNISLPDLGKIPPKIPPSQ